MNFKTLRTQLGNDYFLINREERNLAATLFAYLTNPVNLEIFLKTIEYKYNDVNQINSAKIYYEFSYMRDLWSKQEQNELKMDIIKNSLMELLDYNNEISWNWLQIKENTNPNLNPDIKADWTKALCQAYEETRQTIDSLSYPIDKFNSLFLFRKSSKKSIESPGNWNFKKIANEKNITFRLIAFILHCCFKAKPDIVIEFSDNIAICIEAKLESDIDKYKFFLEKDGKQFRIYIDQIEIQKQIMILFNYTFEHHIIQKKQNDESNVHTWNKVFFNNGDMRYKNNESLEFIDKYLKKIAVT